ncbi:MAG: Fe-Mn family superoxide dismutase [Candidatus Binataceae bacterium]
MSGKALAPSSSGPSRRTLLRDAALFGLGMLGAAYPVFAAPKETGLPFEGLLKGKPGFQLRRPAPLPIAEIPGFLTKEQLAHNYSVYREAFASLLIARTALRSIPRDAAHADAYGKLRIQQITAGNSILLHEFYFRNITPARIKPSHYVLANMTEHMGTLADWREDFAACARVAQAWAVLIYDPYDDRWHNAPLARTDSGGWVGGNPLVVCDVAADAWAIDYKNRAEYVAHFLDHLDWNIVAARYRAVDRH